jgi:hypothetical protein
MNIIIIIFDKTMILLYSISRSEGSTPTLFHAKEIKLYLELY